MGINTSVSHHKLPRHLNRCIPSPSISLAFSDDLPFAVFDETQHRFNLPQQIVVLLQTVAQECSAAPVPHQQGVLDMYASPLQEGLCDGCRGQIFYGAELVILIGLLLLLPRAKWAEGGAVLEGLWGWECRTRDSHCTAAAVSAQGGFQVGGEALRTAEDEHSVALGQHVLQRLQGSFVRKVHQGLVVDGQDDVTYLHQSTLLCCATADEVWHNDRRLGDPLLYQETQTTDLPLEKTHGDNVGLQLAHGRLWLLHVACEQRFLSGRWALPSVYIRLYLLIHGEYSEI